VPRSCSRPSAGRERQAPPAPTSPVRVAVRPQPAAAKQAGPGTLLLAREGSLVTLIPNGKEGTELTAPEGTHTNFDGVLSRDGSRVAYAWARLQPDVLRKDRLTGEDAQVERRCS
jgi:hypothetical protein